MKLRRASDEDAPALEQLHARCFERPWPAADIARMMRALGGFGLIAEDDTGPLGFVVSRSIGGEGEILTLAVDPQARRRGLGAALVEAAALEAARRGASTLFLEVATDNPAAIALYERSGFERAGQRRGYYARRGEPAADALVLRRPLNRP